MKLSVIICTHNPRRDYLGRVLEALRAQTLPPDQWELLLIDNASAEPQAAQWDLSWHPCARVVGEPTPGLSFARRRGVQEAAGEFIVLCDDDNCLAPDYLAVAFEFLRPHPDGAMLGGRGIPIFEGGKPAWFDTVQLAYAVGEPYPGEQEVTNEWGKLWGAGLVVRRSALQCLYANGFENKLTDRRGNQITSGGDHELFMALRIQGWRMWYTPRLVFEHLMTRKRCEWGWYVSFLKGCARNSHRFDPLQRITEQPATTLRAGLKQTAFYQIYLSLRIIWGLPDWQRKIFKPLLPDRDKTHERVFYHKHRIIGLLSCLASYRQRLLAVRNARWAQQPVRPVGR
jgi:glycosyltransferase involved in cell wall biosynthesis